MEDTTETTHPIEETENTSTIENAADEAVPEGPAKVGVRRMPTGSRTLENQPSP